MSITQADLDAAKADILAKVTDRFAALDKLIVPDPPSPPVTTPQIKFASHRYWLQGPKQAADFYDFQDGPSWVRTDFPAAAQTFRYATTCRSAVTDPSAYRQLVPVTVSSAYLARRASGTVVSRTANSDQLLDIGDPALLRSVQSYLGSITSKFDGLYRDEIDETWRYGYPTASTTAQWPDDTTWQNDLVVFVQGISQTLHSLGKKLWINLGSSLSATHPFVSGVVGAADAVNLEYFVGREKIGLGPATGSDLLFLINRVQWLEKTLGKPAHVHVSTMSQTVVDEGFVAWLLGTEFIGSFTASLDYGGDFLLPSSALLANARKLGAPLGGMNAGSEGAVVSRSFTGGKVSLNTNSLVFSVSIVAPN